MNTIYLLVQDRYNPDNDERSENVRYDLGWFPTFEQAEEEMLRRNQELRSDYDEWYSHLTDTYYRPTFGDYLSYNLGESLYTVIAVDSFDKVLGNTHIKSLLQEAVAEVEAAQEALDKAKKKLRMVDPL